MTGDLVQNEKIDCIGLMPGAAPGHGVSQNVAKMNSHHPSGRFQKASQASRGCSRRGQVRPIGEVSLPEVPDPATSKPPRESCEVGSSSFVASCATGERIKEALFSRLGHERFAVWFGGNFEIHVSETGAKESLPQVAVLYDPNYPGDWLRKTFNRDVVLCASEILGGPVAVKWSPLEQASFEDSTSSSDTREADTPRGSIPVPNRTEVHSARGGQKKSPPAGTNCSNAREALLRNTKKASLRRPAVRLDEFSVGSSNRMAYAAVELAASRLGEMSPVLVHGPSGVGKSHLLAGICHHARQSRPGLAVAMFSAEQFTTNFLQALHGSGLPGFRRSCRAVDLLAIDDLQFFVGKRATLLELQSTVDTLHRAGKQIVFASDRDIESLSGLGSELTGRLRGGMTAGIMPPDYEVRRGIVSGLAKKREIDLPADVVDFLANSLTRHARELIGGINRLEAASHMLGAPVTLDLAREALADLVRSSARSLRLADIEHAVCAAFGISEADLKSTRRSRAVNHPRMLAMFLARKHTGAALADIGRHFGRRSHSTVLAAEKTVRKWMTAQSSIVLADATWDVDQAIRRVEDVLRAG
jgi:chromosomal replication initiator protein